MAAIANIDRLIDAVAFDMRESNVDFTEANVGRVVQHLSNSASMLAVTAKAVNESSDRAFTRFVKDVAARMRAY